VAGNMKAYSKIFVCALFFIFLASVHADAQQERDSTLLRRRSTIKLDITSYWLYRNAIMFSYERVVKNKPNQTWGITAGIQEFPSLGSLGSDSVMINRNYKAAGFKVGGEYRFYLKKENKFAAPRGVYIGPYTTFHNYSNGRSIEVNNNGTLEQADLNTDLNIFNVGVQVGYQFVLNDRWTIDLVFIGPSISNYSFKTKYEGNFTFDPDDITNDVVQGLIDKFPAFEELINEGAFSSNGKINTWAYGYRYQFQIGYHFGRKKK
jgi:hypothetical protein